MSPSFDFEAAVSAPFRMQPGLRKLAPGARQLTALNPTAPAFAEKLAVLSHHAGETLLCAPGFDPLPALQALAHEATRQCSTALAVDAGGVASVVLGWRVRWDGSLGEAGPDAHAASGACLEALPAPQRLAGLLSLSLHEDFAVVDGATATLPWMAVCLPSHWAPAEKVGRSFATVHGPVADNATLIAANQHLTRLVCQPQRWERFVWNLTTHPSHDQHPARHARQPWPDEPGPAAARAHWRTEHQTFIPLPALQQAVFTIHVDVQPMALAIATPQRAAALHAALSTMSEAVLAYRGLTTARQPLLDWLAARSSA
ncbi:heme-dependent oxidative N-demethylase subunit alpha family protein [Methylibium sp.]|uniref:heme-dependent oxidative N-demethylase subunit alpha family protein n=1 Tax=Methylibium sp. TaxID=2067992 RepID=UPI003D0FB2BA